MLPLGKIEPGITNFQKRTLIARRKLDGTGEGLLRFLGTVQPAQDQAARYGLQLADIAVSGLTAALEPDFYGNCEPRFARLLKPIVYHRGRNYLSYGAKMVPAAEGLELTNQQQEFVEIYG